MTADRHILSRAKLVALCTLASRVLGLARDMFTGAVFGASAGLDMFVVAFTVPNLFRRLFGEGVLSAAFIPVFTDETINAERDETRLLRVVLTSLTLLLSGIVLAGWLGCAATLLFVELSENGRLFCILLAMLLPYLPLICMTALLGAALQTRHHFLAPALAPTLLNICWIAAVWLFGDRFGVQALAAAVVVAGGLQFALQVPFAWRCGLLLRPLWNLRHPGLRRIAQLTAAVLVGLGVTQLNVLADRIIAQVCIPGDGANSVLFFGNRLIQFPLGVFGLALATAVFPSYARYAAAGNRIGLTNTVNMALRTNAFIALPCTAVTIALSRPIVGLIFERGEFSAQSSARTAMVLFYYGLGLIGFCGIHLLVRAFYALKDMRTPVKVAAMMVGLNLALNLTLVWPLREAGLALSSSVTAILNAGVLYILLKRRLGPLGRRTIALSTLRGLLAAAVAGACAWAAHDALNDVSLPIAPILKQIIDLAGALLAAGAVYLAMAALMGMRELRELRNAARTRHRP